MSFRFSWVLIFLIIHIGFWLIYQSKRNNFIFYRSSKKVDEIISSDLNKNKIKIKNRFLFFGIVFLIIAASGPQIGTMVRPIERKGVDLVIAFDTSISMDSEDVTPSRLSKAKFEISNLIKSLKGDRVSIIVFAGTSHLYLPLTTDYEAALLFLNEIDTEMIPTKGTVLSSAISKGLETFTDENDKFKVMVLVSDGEDHDGRAIELAHKASKAGLMINTVGVGSKSGSLIPIRSKKIASNTVQYKRNNKGKLITSVLNENNLRQIASAGGGSYFWFSNSAESYLDIFQAIERMEKKTISTHEYSEYEDRYQFVALVSLFCFIMTFIIQTRLKKL